jgi:hypothetical protein
VGAEIEQRDLLRRSVRARIANVDSEDFAKAMGHGRSVFGLLEWLKAAGIKCRSYAMAKKAEMATFVNPCNVQ